jgi:hypothetical protein
MQLIRLTEKSYGTAGGWVATSKRTCLGTTNGRALSVECGDSRRRRLIAMYRRAESVRAAHPADRRCAPPA